MYRQRCNIARGLLIVAIATSTLAFVGFLLSDGLEFLLALGLVWWVAHTPLWPVLNDLMAIGEWLKLVGVAIAALSGLLWLINRYLNRHF